MNNETINKILDFIPDMAQELPALAAGEETTIDRLMLAAAICGWITDYEPCDWQTWGRGLGDPDKLGVAAEAGINEGGKAFAMMIERENKDLKTAIIINDCTSEELADLGRVFLNAAIEKRALEQ